MYVSHPVRRRREDPTPGETATVIVTATAATDLDGLRAALDDAGATVEARLRFGALRVRVPEPALSAVCSLDGIESIETAATRGIGGDAGEDV